MLSHWRLKVLAVGIGWFAPIIVMGGHQQPSRLLEGARASVQELGFSVFHCLSLNHGSSRLHVALCWGLQHLWSISWFWHGVLALLLCNVWNISHILEMWVSPHNFTWLLALPQNCVLPQNLLELIKGTPVSEINAWLVTTKCVLRQNVSLEILWLTNVDLQKGPFCLY